MPDRAFLESRGWDMRRPVDMCWLDHNAPGYLKTLVSGVQRWQIVLCPEDAMVLEERAEDGDYAGALTPDDSRAPEWPWCAAGLVAV